MSAFAGATAPTGWLLCDGAAVSRTTYAALFAVIGTAYGAGNGSTTFNVPDLKGRTPVGRDAAQPEFDVLGEAGGVKSVTLTGAQSGVAEHRHVIRAGASVGAAGVNDGYPRAASTGSLDTSFRTGGVAAMAGSSGSNGYGSTTGAQNAAQAHENLQPYLVVNHIIKAL